MWDEVCSPAVGALRKLCDIPVKRAIAVLDVVQHANVLRATLHHDDGHGVVPSQIPDCVNWQDGVIWHRADSAIGVQCVNLVSVDSTLGHAARLTLPNVLVVVLEHRPFGLLALVVQHLREPRVIAPVDLHHPCVITGRSDEALIHLVGVHVRVQRHPYFRALLADRRYQCVQALFADCVRFFDPHQIHALERLDGVHRVALQAREQDQRAVSAANLCIQHLVEGLQAQLDDVVLEQPVHGIAHGLLNFAGTQDAKRLPCAHVQQCLGDCVRLPTSSAAVHDLVPARLI